MKELDNFITALVANPVGVLDACRIMYAEELSQIVAVEQKEPEKFVETVDD